MHFIYATQTLKTGVFDLIEARNIYSINILFRSLIDHFLRFYYIFLSFAEQKNDSAGTHYLKFNLASEHLNYAFSLKSMSEIRGGNINDINVFDLIRKHNPQLKEFSNSKLKKEIKKYSTKNMIKKIVDTIYSQSDVDESSLFLLKLLPQYSELSSFVHGGIDSTHSLGHFGDFESQELTDNIEERFKFAFLIAANILNFSFLAGFNIDEKFKEPFIRSHDVIKRAMKI
ncbi:MAG: DUF5677 domain-containing protein [Candidatus Paceibacterota bacterium]